MRTCSRGYAHLLFKDIIILSELSSILSKHGFKFNKRYGQNFISDTNLLRAIVADSGAQSMDVVEIGAGAGTLTRQLSLIAKSVAAYEIDTSLEPVLQEMLADCGNVSIRVADILEVASQRIDSEYPQGYAVVANLPYYITTPVILKFLEQSKNIRSMTVMVQKEVAKRLTAAPGTPDYGSVSVAVAFAGNACITRIVPRTLFYPVPNVDSAIVRIDIDRNKFSLTDTALFVKIYRQAFAMRRKTLLNNLSAIFKDKQGIADIITGLGFNADIRGERLGAQDFANLTERIIAGGIK